MPSQSFKEVRTRRTNLAVQERPAKVCHAWHLLGKPCLAYTSGEGLFCEYHEQDITELNRHRR